jgi:hypothetical protein
MIKLTRTDEHYFMPEITLTVKDDTTIEDMADALRCFLLACGYHHNLVYGILPDGDEEFEESKETL